MKHTTKEEKFFAIPVDRGFLFSVCQGIAVPHAEMHASILENFVRRGIKEVDFSLTDDDRFVYSFLLEIADALRSSVELANQAARSST